MEPVKQEKTRKTQPDDMNRLIDDLLHGIDAGCSRWRYRKLQKRRLTAYSFIICFALTNILFAVRKSCYSTLTPDNILELAKIKNSIETISEYA